MKNEKRKKTKKCKSFLFMTRLTRNALPTQIKLNCICSFVYFLNYSRKINEISLIERQEKK